MREIKFRVWNNFEKHMDIDLPIMDLPLIKINGHKLMQYTGLKDKNGKEIYEGDIIKFCPRPGSCGIIYSIDGEDAMMRKVVWLDNNAQFGWELFNGSRNQSGYALSQSNESIFKVIGNIYENPELLK